MGCSRAEEKVEATPPVANSRLNELVVVTDKRTWEGAVGDTLRAYYSAAYPILPQPEPLYDLRFFSVEDLDQDPLRKQQRHYLILGNLNKANLSVNKLILKDIGTENARLARTDTTARFLIGRDKWAKSQIVAYQFAYSDADLIQSILYNFSAINNRFELDNARLIETAAFQDKGDNQDLMEEVKKRMDAEIRIPQNYVHAVTDNDLIWLRMEKEGVKSNLIFQKIPYTGQEQLTKEGIKAVQDAIGKKYIATDNVGSYMRISEERIPLYIASKIVDNNETLEARGVWTIANDTMGGPFISYLIHNPQKKDLLFVEGFVHAPGKDKRSSMQQLEYLISRMKY